MTCPDIIVCVGPSLTPNDQKLFDSVLFAPPVSCDDMFRLAASKPRAIGIVDGFFGDGPAVFHKEILWTMAQGINVLGAASMGALRAAELDQFGMIGIGSIYRDFRNGVLTSDGDVAVTHAPAELGYQATSIAAVDARATIDALLERRRIEQGEAEKLRRAVERLHFADRDWKAIAEPCGDTELRCAELERLLKQGHVARKRLDAIELVAEITKPRSTKGGLMPPHTPSFRRALARAGLS